MDLTLIGRALRHHRLLAAVGVVVAILAGVFSAYSVTSAGLEARTASVYRGSATVLLTNPNLSLYAAQMGGAAGSDPAAAPENANLAQLAMVYAWVVSGDDMQKQTEQIVGAFGTGETLTAQRRTTQPTGTEQFGSNAALPIFDIVTNAPTEEQAKRIADAATTVFLHFVAARQDAAGIPPEQRVDVSVLRSADAQLEQGGSGPVSALLVAGVLLFVVFLLIVYREHTTQVLGHRQATGSSVDELPGSVAEHSPAQRSPNGWGEPAAQVGGRPE